MKLTMRDSQGRELRNCKATITLSERNLLTLLAQLYSGRSNPALINEGQGLYLFAESDAAHYTEEPPGRIRQSTDTEVDRLKRLFDGRSVAE